MLEEQVSCNEGGGIRERLIAYLQRTWNEYNVLLSSPTRFRLCSTPHRKKSLSEPIRNTTDNNSFSISPATDTHTQLTSPGNSIPTNDSRESKPFTFPASTAHLVASAPAICARPKLRVGRCQNSPRRCRPRFLHDLGGLLSDLGRCLRMSMSGSRGWLCQSCWVLVMVCQGSRASGS